MGVPGPHDVLLVKPWPRPPDDRTYELPRAAVKAVLWADPDARTATGARATRGANSPRR